MEQLMAGQIDATMPRAPFLREFHGAREKTPNLPHKAPDVARELELSASSSF